MDVPFIGRNEELDSCVRILKSPSEQSRIIMIEGSPGTGKTSILHKIIDAANNEGYLVCSGINSEEHDTLSLRVWMKILEKCRLGMQDASDCANGLESNLFAALYGAWDGIEQFREIGSENKKHLLFSWIGTYLACCSRNRKLCITIDNLHLCGRSSISLLLYLYSILDSHPVSFILSSRPIEGTVVPELLAITEEMQYKPENLLIRLENLTRSAIQDDYDSLKDCNPGLPGVSEIFELTLGNPLGISALLRTGTNSKTESKPLNRLWKRYKDSLDHKTVVFIEYMSILGNYISRTEAEMTAGLCGDQDVSQLLDTCLSASVLIEQGDGYSFFHEEFRKIIHTEIGKIKREERLLQIIGLYEDTLGTEDEEVVVRLAGLYAQQQPSSLNAHHINRLLNASDIMMRWNAWDKAAGYLEKMRQPALDRDEQALLNRIDTRLVFCYLEVMNDAAFNKLFPPLCTRLMEIDDKNHLWELLNLSSFIWNFYPDIFLNVIEYLLKTENERRNILILMKSVIRANDPFTIADSLTEILKMEDSIMQSGSQEDKYKYYTGLGYLQSFRRHFDSAADALFKAESLQIGRFRFLHLLALAKITLFTGFNKDKDLIREKMELALRVTRNDIISITYQGMLQRRYLYDGALDKVLSIGTDPDRDNFDYFSIPRFMAYLWMGDKTKTESLITIMSAYLNENAGENIIHGPLVGILWLLSAYSLITDNREYTGMLKRHLDPLIKSQSIHEGFRIHLLISAARISIYEYSPAECRLFFDELESTSELFLEEEIHSVEIAKGLLANRLEDYSTARGCFDSALRWCLSVEEKPWRSWLLSGQVESAAEDRAEALRIASEGDFNTILKILGESPKNESSYKLSGRELEVLGLVTKGFTDREIGGFLYISEHTVANHLRNIYKKLKVSNRVEASRIALLEELVNS